MNETRQKLKLWDLPALDSRVKSPNVTIAEMIFGYFLGPFLVLAMTTVISTYYLTFYRTYDDIVSNASSFLVLLPLISVIPMALANIIVGVILGRMQTRQGKARPLLFTAAPLLLLSGLVMFLIPYLSLGFRLAWMAITYNIFAAVANPVYSNSHYLMVSLSTRNLDQRGKLSVISNIPAVAGNGLISSIVMPVVLSWINSAPHVLNGEEVGQMIVQNRWQTITHSQQYGNNGCKKIWKSQRQSKKIEHESGKHIDSCRHDVKQFGCVIHQCKPYCQYGIENARDDAIDNKLR